VAVGQDLADFDRKKTSTTSGTNEIAAQISKILFLLLNVPDGCAIHHGCNGKAAVQRIPRFFVVFQCLHSIFRASQPALLAHFRPIFSHFSTLKHVLKARVYRWSDGSDGFARPWHIDVAEDEQAKEIEFLRAEIYRREVNIRARTLTALERFSGRA
jgi:hypothetical protein